MTEHMTEAQDQWDQACQVLNEEFQLNASELPTIETAKALFLQLVGRRGITQEAANALMYSLYFSGYLSTLFGRIQGRSATRFNEAWNTSWGVLNPSRFLGR